MFSRQRVRRRQQLINLVSDAPTVQVNNRKAKHPGARGRARRETGVDDHVRDRRQSPGADCNEIRLIFEMIQGGLGCLSILSLSDAFSLSLFCPASFTFLSSSLRSSLRHSSPSSSPKFLSLLLSLNNLRFHLIWSLLITSQMFCHPRYN